MTDDNPPFLGKAKDSYLGFSQHDTVQEANDPSQKPLQSYSHKILVLGAKDAGSRELTCFPLFSNMEILVVTPVADAGQAVKAVPSAFFYCCFL